MIKVADCLNFLSNAVTELLKLLDLQLGGENQIEMTPLLKEKLQEADVINIVEPFWTTNYKQLDTVAAKSPPFFSKSKDYFSWLSSFCRFLVSRSYTNKKSAWNDFFHSCRSAIRSKPGVGVAEFRKYLHYAICNAQYRTVISTLLPRDNVQFYLCLSLI